MDERPRDWLAQGVLKEDRGHLAREFIASTFLVALLFTMTTLHASFLRTMGNAEIALDGTDLPVRITPNGIEFFRPQESWIWNSSSIVLDKALFSKMVFLRDAFTMITLTTVGLIVAREVAAARAYAKRELEPRKGMMAAMWALGAHRLWILDAFTTGKSLILACAYVGGVTLSILAVLPSVHAVTNPTAANLFFGNGPDLPAFALAGSLPIAAWLMHTSSVAMMLREKSLREATREFS